jgi:DNA polymerase-4
MGGAKARRLCPDLVVAASDWDAYMEASRAVFAIFERHVEAIERGSMEEAFLDASEADEDPVALARRLRHEVREEVGLPLSIGVARTKLLAKMASRSAKPDGLFVVEPERELEFLHPLPVERVWGVGPASASRLRAHGLTTVGEVARLGEGELMAILGKAAGRYVHAVAQNRDQRRVRRRRGRRSIGSQHAMRPGPHPRAELDEAIGELAERVTSRMRRKDRAGRTVVLRLRFGDYTRASRSRTLAHPTADPAAIATALRELLDGAMPVVSERGITLIGLTMTNLDEASAHQLALELPA